MKKVLFLLGLAVLCLTQPVHAQQSKSKTTDKKAMKASIHSFKVEDLYGKTFDFSTLTGKKILVVNTASECGLTPQYKDLEALYEKYKDKLVIVGFPANNFGAQEPGTNQEIGAFCQKN